MSIADDEILKMYVEESREHLANIENDLLAMESGGANIDEELVNKVFRAAHSIKGGAGFFSLAKIQELGHKMENVLDMVRSRELVPTPDMTNILLLAFDKLRELINNVDKSNEADISEFTVSLAGLVSANLPGSEKQSLNKMVDVTMAGRGVVMKVPEFDLTHARREGHTLYLLEFDLIHDVERLGKTPMDMIKAMTDLGIIMESGIDLSSLGTLDDDPVGKIPYLVLYACTLEPEKFCPIFDLDASHVTVFMKPEKAASAPAPSAAKTPPPAPVAAQSTVEEDMVTNKPEQSADEAAPVEATLVAEEQEAHPPPEASEAAPAASGKAGVDASLRVDVTLLESLMNLAGELVLSRNQLLEAISRNDQRVIHIGGQRINQVTSELQEAIMLTRLQPIGNIFNKFPRVVRDLSKELGKNITLNIEGKEVALDKTIIEGLSDPLTHMVRNAVDHGIEAPDVRAKAGKNAVGEVNLRAYHEAGHVIVEVSDDGKGIDPTRVAAAAVAKNLITAKQAKTMSEKEMTALIFLPGLSTAEKVTGVSGRGVGMDVVKTNLDRLGGKVEIDSKIGRGSTFRIKLPLTLAIIPSLLVSVSGERFAIPQVNVEEMIRVTPDQTKVHIEIVGDAEVLILRGKMIPIIHLADVLGIQRVYVDPADGDVKDDRRENLADRRSRVTKLDDEGRTIPRTPEEEKAAIVSAEQRSGQERRFHAASNLNVVVVSSGAFQYGLVVEQLHDTLEIVVKPLGQHSKFAKEYAGATIMGDGRVALILDVAGLATMASLTSLAGTSRAKEVEAQKQKELQVDVQTLLLFRNSPEEHCAVQLDLVDRIEQVKASDIQTMGGKRVLKYRGGSLPLFTLADVAQVNPLPEQENLIVLIFTMGDHKVGFLVLPPLDVLETRVEIDQKTVRQKGISGTALVNDRLTLMLDIFELVETMYPEWFVNKPQVAVDGGTCDLLLAEDSEFFRSQMKKFLSDGGYNVTTAVDGLDAWNFLQEKGDHIRLLVTDVEMPQMDGLELTRKIRNDPRFSKLPVIAVTSLAGDEDMAKGKAAGVDDYQVKFDRDKLLTSVARLVARES